MLSLHKARSREVALVWQWGSVLSPVIVEQSSSVRVQQCPPTCYSSCTLSAVILFDFCMIFRIHLMPPLGRWLLIQVPSPNFLCVIYQLVYGACTLGCPKGMSKSTPLKQEPSFSQEHVSPPVFSLDLSHSVTQVWNLRDIPHWPVFLCTRWLQFPSLATSTFSVHLQPAPLPLHTLCNLLPHHILFRDSFLTCLSALSVAPIHPSLPETASWWASHNATALQFP